MYTITTETAPTVERHFKSLKAWTMLLEKALNHFSTDWGGYILPALASLSSTYFRKSRLGLKYHTEMSIDGQVAITITLWCY